MASTSTFLLFVLPWLPYFLFSDFSVPFGLPRLHILRGNVTARNLVTYCLHLPGYTVVRCSYSLVIDGCGCRSRSWMNIDEGGDSLVIDDCSGGRQQLSAKMLALQDFHHGHRRLLPYVCWHC